MSNKTVLTCPFCGHEPELILRGNAFTKKRNAEIKCHNCGAEMVVGAIRNNLEWCKEKVIERWNKREAREKVIGELVEWNSAETPPNAFMTVLLDYGGDNGICSGYYQNVEKTPSYVPHFKFMSGNTPVAWMLLPPASKSLLKQEGE